MDRSVSEITYLDSKDKNAWACFKNGSKAVTLTQDPRCQQLFTNLVSDNLSSSQKPFWENSLENLAKSHFESRPDLGDMIRFFPSQWGHIARKSYLIRNKLNGQIEIVPNQNMLLSDGNLISQETLQMAWNLASDILESCLPPDYDFPEYAVSLQVLKYPNSYEDYLKLFNLIKDSSTAWWAKKVEKLDIKRNNILLSMPFDLPYATTFYHYGSLLPFVNDSLALLNKTVFKRYSEKPEGYSVIGPPHIDASRAFTMLIGDRKSILTEIYDSKQWHELKLDTGSVQIFPGGYMSKTIGVKPVYHRYSIINKNDSSMRNRSPNVSLVLGIVDRKLISKEPVN